MKEIYNIKYILDNKKEMNNINISGNKENINKKIKFPIQGNKKKKGKFVSQQAG